jgi:hypothetical protein
MSTPGVHPYVEAACFYCDSTQGPIVRDHFVPVSLGGRDGARNRVNACWWCDRRKGNLHPRDWMRLCPPAGIQRVAVKLKQLGLSLDDEDRPRGRPGRVKASPPRDGRSTSDGPGSWYGRPLPQPMPSPSWVQQESSPNGVRSLREHAGRYREVR